MYLYREKLDPNECSLDPQWILTSYRLNKWMYYYFACSVPYQQAARNRTQLHRLQWCSTRNSKPLHGNYTWPIWPIMDTLLSVVVHRVFVRSTIATLFTTKCTICCGISNRSECLFVWCMCDSLAYGSATCGAISSDPWTDSEIVHNPVRPLMWA